MFVNNFLKEVKEIVDNIDTESISNVIKVVKDVKNSNGRIFFAGSGGGAGHSSHAVCDFRKLLLNDSKRKSTIRLKYNVIYIKERLSILFKSLFDKDYRNWVIKRVFDINWQLEKMIQLGLKKRK